ASALESVSPQPAGALTTTSVPIAVVRKRRLLACQPPQRRRFTGVSIRPGSEQRKAAALRANKSGHLSNWLGHRHALGLHGPAAEAFDHYARAVSRGTVLPTPCDITFRNHR